MRDLSSVKLLGKNVNEASAMVTHNSAPAYELRSQDNTEEDGSPMRSTCIFPSSLIQWNLNALTGNNHISINETIVGENGDFKIRTNNIRSCGVVSWICNLCYHLGFVIDGFFFFFAEFVIDGYGFDNLFFYFFKDDWDFIWMKGIYNNGILCYPWDAQCL